MERRRNNRRGSLPRPRTYVSKHSAQNEHFGIYGIFEREKCNNNISKIWEYEICIPKSRIWCKGYYVDTVGKNTKAIQEYVANQLKADREADQLSLFDPRDPLTGSK